MNDRAERIRKHLTDVQQSHPCFPLDTELTINLSNSLGDTPFHVAVRLGDQVLVEDLIVAGAEVNHRGENGYTALHYAISRNYEAIVALLLASGASSTIPNDVGKTPEDIASRRGNLSLLR